MPSWLEDVLKQSPILAASLGVGWFAFRYIAKQHEDHLKALDAQRDEHLQSLVAAYDKHLPSKEMEAERLQTDKEALQKEKDSLLKMLREVQKNP
jgi:hypothetical protein